VSSSAKAITITIYYLEADQQIFEPTYRTLTVPRTHNRFGDRSFAVAGPRLWNSLSLSLLWTVQAISEK